MDSTFAVIATNKHVDDLTRLGIARASDLIRRKRLSPVELTEACLARIDRLNPRRNCLITVTAKSASYRRKRPSPKSSAAHGADHCTVYRLH